MWFLTINKNKNKRFIHEMSICVGYSLRRECRARMVRRNAEAAIVMAERAVLASDEGDRAVEDFVKWLPEAREAIESARETEREAGFDVALAFYNIQTGGQD